MMDAPSVKVKPAYAGPTFCGLAEEACDDATRYCRMKTLHRRTLCLLLLLVTIPLGLAWRMIPLGLSPFFFKYGGSMLWAMALYWLIAACLPRRGSGALALIAAVARCGGKLPSQRANLTVRHFDGGHMFYAWEKSRKAFRAEIEKFYKSATAV